MTSESRAAESALAVLREGGLDLMGLLEPQAWDAHAQEGWCCDRLLTGARSVLVIGSGGRSLGRAVGEERLSAPDSPHPFDDHSRRVLDAAAAMLPGPARALLYSDRLGPDGRPEPEGEFVDLIALAEAAGLGRPGRLRLLLHPDLGPWLSIRGVLVSRMAPETWRPLLGMLPQAWPPLASPCEGCSAPCVAACPGGALDGGLLDLERCIETRLAGPPCDEACAARRACVLGREHAYSAPVEAHHARASLAYARTS